MRGANYGRGGREWRVEPEFERAGITFCPKKTPPCSTVYSQLSSVSRDNVTRDGVQTYWFSLVILQLATKQNSGIGVERAPGFFKNDYQQHSAVPPVSPPGGARLGSGAYHHCSTSCLRGPHCGDRAIRSSEGEQCDNGFKDDDYAYKTAMVGRKVRPTVL